MKYKTSEDLVTTREQTRAGFINFALEKNRLSTPVIENARTLKVLASKIKTPKDLLTAKDIRAAMLTAAGLSDKALTYFTEEDKDAAIKELIRNFLEPAGEYFVDELVYRYLLTRGDSLGGSMRNLVGVLAQQKLIRTLLSCMDIMGVEYQWLCNKSKKWQHPIPDTTEVEKNMKAISWQKGRKHRTLALNLTIPIVKNNIDICLFNSTCSEYDNGGIVNQAEKILMLGELKGGIDPAGADEHWKTGNTAMNRIRNAFNKAGIPIATSFVAASIEKKMASEIFKQLESKTLSAAANLTKDDQLVNYCNWIIKF